MGSYEDGFNDTLKELCLYKEAGGLVPKLMSYARTGGRVAGKSTKPIAKLTTSIWDSFGRNNVATNAFQLYSDRIANLGNITKQQAVGLRNALRGGEAKTKAYIEQLEKLRTMPTLSQPQTLYRPGSKASQSLARAKQLRANHPLGLNIENADLFGRFAKPYYATPYFAPPSAFSSTASTATKGVIPSNGSPLLRPGAPATAPRGPQPQGLSGESPLARSGANTVTPGAKGTSEQPQIGGFGAFAKAHPYITYGAPAVLALGAGYSMTHRD